MSLRDANLFLDELGVNRSHVAIHEWVHKTDLQPLSTVTADQLAVNEKMSRLHGQEFGLCGAVDPQTNEIPRVSIFPIATKQTTQWSLPGLHRRYQLDDVVFLVDGADYSGPALAEDSYRLRILAHGNRNAIKRIIFDVEL